MFKPIFIFTAMIMLFFLGKSQSSHSLGNSKSNPSEKVDSTQIDVNDVLAKIFKKKKVKEKKIKPIRNFQAAFLPTVGYSLQTGFSFVYTGNVTFSTNRKDSSQKLSSIYAGITYSLQNQIILPTIANIWTKNNKYNIILDNRFIQYPDYVFGVGDATSKTKEYRTFFSMLRMHESILREVKPNLYLGVGFMHDNIWNISGFDSINKVINPASTKKVKREIATGLALRFLFDSRLNQVNAKKGFYSNIVFRKNLTTLGSDETWGYLTTDTRAYIPFPKKSNNVLAFWNYNMITYGGNNVSNFLLPSNGWDDTHNTGRGNIQGRFRGRNMFAFETEYRFSLTKNGLLGATVFGNVQHFDNQFFYNSGFLKPGGGVGLRIKFNKHSNTNVCIDYGFGQGGSRGFFVNVGEVF
ncbi:MAG: hypothetical protein ACOVMI_01440 [Chitinophagaceae bacterium]|jgi:hypothetical protein